MRHHHAHVLIISNGGSTADAELGEFPSSLVVGDKSFAIADGTGSSSTSDVDGNDATAKAKSKDGKESLDLTVGVNKEAGQMKVDQLTIKKTVAGAGAARKGQVAMMVARLLRLAHPPRPADAADGVAVALTHILRA